MIFDFSHFGRFTAMCRITPACGAQDAADAGTVARIALGLSGNRIISRIDQSFVSLGQSLRRPSRDACDAGATTYPEFRPAPQSRMSLRTHDHRRNRNATKDGSGMARDVRVPFVAGAGCGGDVDGDDSEAVRLRHRRPNRAPDIARSAPRIRARPRLHPHPGTVYPLAFAQRSGARRQGPRPALRVISSNSDTRW